MTISFRRTIVVLFVLVVLGLISLDWEALWWWATTRKVYVQGLQDTPESLMTMSRGWYRVRRWGPEEPRGPFRSWWVETGYLAAEGHNLGEGKIRYTSWHPRGRVRLQRDGHPRRWKEVRSPPWLWGVTDQSVPTMPPWYADEPEWLERYVANQPTGPRVPR